MVWALTIVVSNSISRMCFIFFLSFNSQSPAREDLWSMCIRFNPPARGSNSKFHWRSGPGHSIPLHGGATAMLPKGRIMFNSIPLHGGATGDALNLYVCIIQSPCTGEQLSTPEVQDCYIFNPPARGSNPFTYSSMMSLIFNPPARGSNRYTPTRPCCQNIQSPCTGEQLAFIRCRTSSAFIQSPCTGEQLS